MYGFGPGLAMPFCVFLLYKMHFSTKLYLKLHNQTNDRRFFFESFGFVLQFLRIYPSCKLLVSPIMVNLVSNGGDERNCMRDDEIGNNDNETKIRSVNGQNIHLTV